MYTIEHHVGRLLETKMQGRVTRTDIETAVHHLQNLALPPDEHVVVIGDYRATKFLLEEDTALLIKVLRSINDRLERSAVVVSASSAVGVLQMERMVRESKHPSRRAFRDAREAAAWLEEILRPAEKDRLRAFLGI